MLFINHAEYSEGIQKPISDKMRCLLNPVFRSSVPQTSTLTLDMRESLPLMQQTAGQGDTL